MLTSTKCKTDKALCSFGCPVTLRYITPDELTCENLGYPEVTCTDPESVMMEIQPYQAGAGEMSSCEVNGITVDIKFKFWYEPDPLHLVTPNSKFVSNGFNAADIFGTKAIVHYLGCDFIVWDLMNWTGGCFNHETSDCEPVADDCGKITLQSGVLIPFAECFGNKDTTPKDEDYFIEDVTQWERVDS